MARQPLECVRPSVQWTQLRLLCGSSGFGIKSGTPEGSGWFRVVLRSSFAPASNPGALTNLGDGWLRRRRCVCVTPPGSPCVRTLAAQHRDAFKDFLFQHVSSIHPSVRLLLLRSLLHWTPASRAVTLLLVQVVDLCSTWRRLGPVLSVDQRPSVVKAFTQVLALVPELTAKSRDYEVAPPRCCCWTCCRSHG